MEALQDIVRKIELLAKRLGIVELKETPILTVEEQDASPTVTGVNKIKVTNGTLTNNGNGVVSLSTGGGGVSDGDKGDITVSGTGTVWTIDNDAVTYAKIQNVSASPRFLGRKSSGAGDIEEIDIAYIVTELLLTGSAGVLFNHNFNSILGTSAGGNGGLEFNQNANGGYTCAPATPPSGDALGVWEIRSNAASGAASGAIYQSGPGTFLTMAFGSVSLDLTIRFRMNALPASGQDYRFIIGFADSRSTTPSNGAFLFFDFAGGFTNFRYRTRKAGSQTDVDSGLAAAANTWYKLRIQIDTSSNVIFTIDGANSQTLSTNVPNGTGETVSIMMFSERVSGTNDRILYFDYERLAWSGGPS